MGPVLLALVYIAAIPGFGAVYYHLPSEWECPLSVVDAMYLSAVTITTLGYGDITPVGNIAKVLVSAQAVLGVFALGLFLLMLANNIAASLGSRQAEASRANFRSQYNQFKEDMVAQVLAVTDGALYSNFALREELVDAERFREYFDSSTGRWNEFRSNFDNDEYAKKTMKDLLVDLERNLEALLLRSSSTDGAVLEGISNYRNWLHRLQRLDLDHYDDTKQFVRGIDSILAQRSTATGIEDSDPLLDMVDKA